MIKDMSFGGLLYELRLKREMTLREFCLKSKVDAGNFSKMERNLMSPPNSKEKLLKLIKALEPNHVEIELLEGAAINHHIGKTLKNWESK